MISIKRFKGKGNRAKHEKYSINKSERLEKSLFDLKEISDKRKENGKVEALKKH